MLSRHDARLVTTARELLAGGVSRGQLATELHARRWRRVGLAVVQHRGPLSHSQRCRVARIHAGPQSVLTAFTAAQAQGVRGWQREAIDVLAPAGTRLRPGCPFPVRLHLHGERPIRVMSGGGVEILPDSLLRAAATFAGARPACGLLAAAVQQRQCDPSQLRDALARALRTRHRAVLLAAVQDIEGGADALSEIDFTRLCRRRRLPAPIRQLVRGEPNGRRRFLDATWRRSDGRLVVAEIDGALHLLVSTWWSDQLRQNELALADALILRFPTVVMRTEEHVVADQLRRALLL